MALSPVSVNLHPVIYKLAIVIVDEYGVSADAVEPARLDRAVVAPSPKPHPTMNRPVAE
jgi:hypothetical protein